MIESHYFYGAVTLLMLVNFVLVSRTYGIRSPMYVNIPVGCYFSTLALFVRFGEAPVVSPLLLVLNLLITLVLYFLGRDRHKLVYEPLWTVLKRDRELRRQSKSGADSP